MRRQSFNHYHQGKTRFLQYVWILSLVLSPLSNPQSVDADDPIDISSCLELQDVGSDPSDLPLDGYYRLLDHIDCTFETSDPDGTLYNGGEGFDPIGSELEPFIGILDAQGFSITGLHINRGEVRVGLFSSIDAPAEILNLDLIDIDIANSLDYTAGLVGYMQAGSINNVNISGISNISGGNKVGGLVGFASSDVSITNSSVTVDVDGGSDVGGLIGENAGIVSQSVSVGSVSGVSNIGGLAGFSSGDINESQSQSSAIGSGNNIGGLVGENQGNITDSYAVSNISSMGDNAGGLVGYNNGNVEGSHATGEVEGINHVGGLAGYNSATITSSYAEGDVSASDSYAGGLVGYNDNNITLTHASGRVTIDEDSGFGAGGLAGYNEGEIYRSYSEGDIYFEHTNNVWDIGGLVGENHGLISQSFSTSNVVDINGAPIADTNFVGGLVGTLNGGSITNTYARGATYSTLLGGSLVGDVLDGEVSNSYGTGEVSGDDLGGLIGDNWNDAPVTNSFWDMDSTGIDEANNTSGSGTGKTTEEMKDVRTYTDEEFSSGLDLPVWDFVGNPNDDVGLDDIWSIDSEGVINDGYPFFDWWWQLQQEGDGDDNGNGDDGEDNGDDEIETNLDNDKNGDGIPDDQQDNVAYIISPITGELVVLEVDEQCSITALFIVSEDDNDVSDIGYDYPQGFITFTINCVTPGYTSDIILYYYGIETSDLDKYLLRKHNPNTGAYFSIEGVSIDTTNIYSEMVLRVNYQATDGGELDIDGETNGIITDPVGLGVEVVGVPDTGLGGGR